MRHDQAVVCGQCGSHVRAALARTARLAGQVAVTIAKLDEIATEGTPHLDDLGWWKEAEALEAVPLPINLHASQSYGAAYAELATWVKHCCETRGIDHAGGRLDVLCGFLAGQVDWLRHREEGREALKAIDDACRQIERIVDRAPERVIVGACPCGWWLYALAGSDTVQCQGCGTGYDVEASRQQLRDDLEDRLMTASQIALMAVHLGIAPSRDRTRKTVVMWAQRGRIVSHGHVDGDPAYRFGDTLGLLLDAYARAA